MTLATVFPKKIVFFSSFTIEVVNIQFPGRLLGLCRLHLKRYIKTMFYKNSSLKNLQKCPRWYMFIFESGPTVTQTKSWAKDYYGCIKLVK